MGLFLPDVRAGWLRKVPSPQEFGMRENPTMDDVTSLTIYLHAIWFVTNTASHIAVGDVSAVTSIERIYVSVFIWIASFLYAFLFGNIVSIVSDFAPVHQ
jgi:nitrate/nitrite transporter NarK